MVARILPFLSTEQAADILMTTARNLPFLIKKDAQDEVILMWEGGMSSLGLCSMISRIQISFPPHSFCVAFLTFGSVI